MSERFKMMNMKEYAESMTPTKEEQELMRATFKRLEDVFSEEIEKIIVLAWKKQDRGCCGSGEVAVATIHSLAQFSEILRQDAFLASCVTKILSSMKKKGLVEV